MAKKETNTKLEITICDIKLGWNSKTSLRLHSQWHRHAQQRIKV